MRIFWSWQNDAEPKRHRYFIKAAVEAAIGEVALELNVDDADRPEIDHDTRAEKGAVVIADTIMRKIAESAIFIADVTPIARSSKDKALPNPNVMIELGWAMNEPGFERHIYVMNTADGFSPDDLPFDIRGRLVMTYDLPEGAEKKARDGIAKALKSQLSYALRTNLEDHLDDTASQTEIVRVVARADDPSIWSSADGTISHYDDMSSQGEAIVALVDGPRSYIRVSPAGWRSGAPPAVGEVEAFDVNYAVSAPAEGAASGSFGATREGFVRYWLTGEGSTANVAMFFDETGEFWVLHGSAIHAGTLGVASVLKAWASTLRRANLFMDYYNASPVRRVEVGIVGLEGVRWPADNGTSRRPARKTAFAHEAVDRDWSAERQRDFLVAAYTRLTDVFGLPVPSVEAAERMIDANDRDRALSPP